ncbi:MAG: gfo/Idh/MocA family oxidoreductase [Balneolaceae bacterium]|nr:MAG: gfo/Idh/MocA family oxidoreductase [Balneolaceae bacterium]
MNRRNFLELTASLAGTTLLTTTMPWFSVFNQPASFGKGAGDRVRIGVIGVGSRGRALYWNLRELQQHMNIEIVAVCDNYLPHYERAIDLTGGEAEAFLDYREMIENVELDGVVIATPLHEHAQQTIDCLQAGIHVFCEKAMARTLDEVKAMYDAWKESGKVMLIGHQRLFNPVYLESMQRIQRGDIGPVTMMRGWWHRNTDWVFYRDTDGRGTPLDRQRNWRFYDDYSAGMISELGSHHFQVANWVLGSQPLSVMGSGSINHFKDGREVWDNFSLVFKYPEDIHFSYDCITSNKHNGMQVQVLGNDGTIELESNMQYEEFPADPPAVQSLIRDIEEGANETIPIGGATWIPDAPIRLGGRYISPDYELNDTLLYMEGFINFIREGTAPEKLTLEGYNASTWTLLAEEATKTGRDVTLPEKYRVSG